MRRAAPVRLVTRLVVAQAAAAAAVGLAFSRRHQPSVLITLALVLTLCVLAFLVRSGARGAWLAAVGFESVFFVYGVSRFVVARYVGGTAVPAPLREENDFRMDVAEVESLVTDRTRLIIFNSPHNPTGSTLSPDEIREIARIAVEHDLVVLADEIYGRLQYEGELLSIATLPGMAERTITLDGFSKTFAMTGWRLGYGIVPEWLLTSYSRLVINSVSCTNAFAQAGAIAALTGPQDEPNAFRTEFIARRSLIVDGLNAIDGVTCVMPHGAFYAFPNVSSFGRSSVEIADHLLYDGGVCGLSGTAFGRFGEGYLRFSYANSQANIRTALERIESSLAKLERTGELATAASLSSR